MLKGNDVWKAYTDPNLLQEGVEAAKPVRSTLSAPLRSLLSSMDRGELDWRHGTSANAFSRDLPTHAIYKEDPNKLVANLMGPDSLSHQRQLITDAKATATPTSMPFHEVMASKKEEDVRKWVHEVREHHEKTVRQTLVDYQIKGYRPTVAKEANTTPLANQQAAVNAIEAPPIQQTARQNAASLTQGIIEDPTNLPRAGKSMLSRGLDALQTGLDAIGVADPTPIADGINAGISLVRAFTEPENAGTHVSNAAISAVGMVPYIGDFAKLAKYGRKGANAASHAGTSTASASGHAAGYAATQGPNTGAFGSSGNSGGAIPPTPNGTGTPGPGPSGENPSNSGNSGVSGNITANWILPAIAAAQKQLQPDQYSGNQFDSATSTVDRFQSAVDVFVPKLSSLGVAISSVSSAFNSWLAWFKKIESAGDRMLEQNKMLAQYNGNLAGAYAELDQGRFNREVQRSDENGGALGRLANEQNRFEDTRQKLFGPFETLQINVQTHLTRFSNNLLTLIDNNEQITELLRDAQKDDKAKAEARNALEFSMWERGLVQNAKIPNKLNRK